MATTRAARAAARPAARQLIELPADALGLVLYQLTLAHDIAAVAPTCHVLCDAAKLAQKARPFSGEVVTLVGQGEHGVRCVAAVPDGRIIIGTRSSVEIYRDGVCERTIQAHAVDVNALAVLSGGARFVSVSHEGIAKLWTLDGALERNFEMGLDNNVLCVAAVPDGAHFVVGLGAPRNDLLLYHVDGTLVHTFKGNTAPVWGLAVTPDGQHIISASQNCFVKVWSVASKSLVSTCRGHTHIVFAVAAMPDGQRILSCSADKTVRVWRLDGTLQNTFRLHNLPAALVHEYPVEAIVALPDNQHALSGGRDSTVRLFNVNDGAVLRTFKHHIDWVSTLALLPDGRRFVSGSDYETDAFIVEHGLAPQVASR